MASRLLLIVVLCVLVPTFSPAQPPEGLLPIEEVPAAWRSRARELRDFYRARAALEFPPNPLPPLQCHLLFKMEVTFWGDPHVSETNSISGSPDRFRLMGPQPVDGSWIVTPENSTPGQWNHPWPKLPKSAVPIPVDDPETDDQGRFIRFALHNVNVAPHDGQPEKLHEYEMTIVAWHRDGCPDKIEFLDVRHTDGPILDDPGHGGAGRG